LGRPVSIDATPECGRWGEERGCDGRLRLRLRLLCVARKNGGLFPPPSAAECVGRVQPPPRLLTPLALSLALLQALSLYPLRFGVV
ncbi:hypothetical protein H4R99_008714, partial [Coemansia sp. RSA 1722]